MRIVSGHQPVYLPWLGLIHKASLSDVFIFMDDVQYLKEDWINRNKIKTAHGHYMWLTVPVNLKSSKSKTIKDILIFQNDWQDKHWKSIKSSYGKAPYFREYKDFFEWLYMDNRWMLLSELNLVVLKQIFQWFKIKTQLVIASDYGFRNKKSDLILEHALAFDANVVITGIHGREYIKEISFEKHGIKVIYQEYKHPVYQQRFGDFLSHLSFIDLLFNCGKDSSAICLKENLTRDTICNLLKK